MGKRMGTAALIVSAGVLISRILGQFREIIFASLLGASASTDEYVAAFAIPDFLKAYRKGKQYLFLGLRMTRDTERMILSEMIYGAGEPAGWALIAGASDKELRFCKRLGIRVIDADIDDLLAAPGNGLAATHKEMLQDVGC